MMTQGDPFRKEEIAGEEVSSFHSRFLTLSGFVRMMKGWGLKGRTWMLLPPIILSD